MDFDSVLAHLNTNRVRAAGGEPHVARIAQPIRVSLPAPTKSLTRTTGPEIDGISGGSADSVDRVTGGINAVGKLHEERIVPLRVVCRVDAEPDAISRGGARLKRRIEVVRRTCERRRDRCSAV